MHIFFLRPVIFFSSISEDILFDVVFSDMYIIVVQVFLGQFDLGKIEDLFKSCLRVSVIKCVYHGHSV